MVWDNSRLNRKGKMHTDIADAEYQHYYRDNYSNCVNWNVYRKVWRDITKLVINEMMINNYQWKFPCGLGSLQMKKYKTRLRIKNDKLNTENLHVDWNETRLLWESDPDAKERKIRIFHQNYHTDGYKVVFYWNRPKDRLSKIKKYRFYPGRIITQKLSEVLKKHQNKSDYFEIKKPTLYKIK
jgi:hypothetical protein